MIQYIIYIHVSVFLLSKKSWGPLDNAAVRFETGFWCLCTVRIQRVGQQRSAVCHRETRVPSDTPTLREQTVRELPGESRMEKQGEQWSLPQPEAVQIKCYSSVTELWKYTTNGKQHLLRTPLPRENSLLFFPPRLGSYVKVDWHTVG